MNLDTELVAWQREWRVQSEALPDVRKKIRRQDRRTWIAISFACICLFLSLLLVWRTHTAFLRGLASGLWFSCITMGAYAWWVRRGTWKPAAQTTAAYIELWHKRAVAKERIARVAFWFLFATVVLYVGFAAWNWKDLSAANALVLAAMTGELFLLNHIARKKQKEIKVTQKLLESSQEDSDSIFGEGRF